MDVAHTLDCLLLFPPPGFQFTIPELGLPQLSGFLKKNGVAAEAFDLNIVFMNEFLPRYKKLFSDRVSSRIASRGGHPLFRSIDKETFIELDFKRCFLNTYNFIQEESMRLLGELVSITNNEYDIRKMAVLLKQDDPLFDFFLQHHVFALAQKAAVVGFSVLTPLQLGSALYFSRKIKERFPATRIVIGGAWCICSRAELSNFKQIFDFVDFVVNGEGEVPLLSLINALKKGAPPQELRSIKGLVFLSGRSLIDTGDAEIVPLNDLPLGDFDHCISKHDVSRALPVSTTKGCYWHKCRFCHHINDKTIMRQKSVERIINEIESLQKRYSLKAFTFADSSTPVPLLLKVAEQIIKRKIKVQWDCLIRADYPITPAEFLLLKRSGATFMAVGLETSNQEFLNTLRKGIDLLALDRFLDSALEAGMKIDLFIMSYPFQEKREYIETWEYVLFRREKISGIIPQYFAFGRNTSIYSHQKGFRLRQPETNAYDTRSFSLPYSSEGGMLYDEFISLSIAYADKFNEKRDNYEITKRIVSSKNKKYLLIRPPTMQGEGMADLYSEEPAGLLKIGAFLKDRGHRISLIDCLADCWEDTLKESYFFKSVQCGNFAQEKRKKKLYRRGTPLVEFLKRLEAAGEPDEIFITSQFTYEYDFVRQIVTAAQKKFPGAVICVGGILASLCAPLVRKLGVEVFVGVFYHADNYQASFNLLANFSKKMAVIKFSRGCVNSCTYCAVPFIEGKKTYFRSLDLVMDEIRQKYEKYGVRTFTFWESNVFGAKNTYFDDFLQRLIDLKFKMEIEFPEGLQPDFISKGVARKLLRAHVKQVCLAFEVSARSFPKVYLRPRGNTGFYTAVSNLKSVGWYNPALRGMSLRKAEKRRPRMYLRDNQLSAFVLIGLPDQSRQEIINTIIELWKCAVAVKFNAFTPIPNTGVFRKYESEFSSRSLSELHPSVWPCASPELTTDFLEKVFTYNYTSSFFESKSKFLLKEFKSALAPYVRPVSFKDISADMHAIKARKKETCGFEVIDFKIRQEDIDLAALKQIRRYLSLRRRHGVFLVYKPIPKCLLDFGESWYTYYVPRDCDYCLKITCQKRGKNVPGRKFCRGCRHLNVTCKACFFEG
ncbi:MAG: radical SAM protein [Candidatus Omnitrophota bacterium]